MHMGAACRERQTREEEMKKNSTLMARSIPELLNLGRQSGVHDSASLKEPEPITRLKMR